jgi:DNA-binding response OmpR family regulator
MTTHVLLVDNEQAITENLAPFLTRSGFTVSVPGDRASGIVACHRGETGLRSRPGQGTVITLGLPAGESGR